MLINNAGVLKLKQEYSLEGIEMTMAVNLVAVYRLTEILLKSFKPFNIINMTSELFKKGEIDIAQLNRAENYNGSSRYNDSKKALLFYTYWLSMRLKGESSVIAMHPGVVATNAFRDYPKFVMKFLNLFLERPDKAASKIIEPFIKEEIVNGYYYSQNKRKEILSSFVDDDLLKSLIKGLNKTEV